MFRSEYHIRIWSSPDNYWFVREEYDWDEAVETAKTLSFIHNTAVTIGYYNEVDAVFFPKENIDV